MRVLKFGGTSLDGAERIEGAAHIIAKAVRRDQVLVVVSALAGVTNALTAAIKTAERGAPPSLHDLEKRHLAVLAALAGGEETPARHLRDRIEQARLLLHGVALLGECPATTRHRILALGERLSAPLLALALSRHGLEGQVIDGSELIVTGPPEAARVDSDATRHRAQSELESLDPNRVPVVTGFVGSDPEGQTTTLGRGASDLSATLLAAALDADGVEIWSDVDGVLSADPRLEPEAFPLPHLTYTEAADLATFGAKVMHPRTLEPVADRNIPVWIRNSLRPEVPGTLINGTCREVPGTRPEVPGTVHEAVPGTVREAVPGTVHEAVPGTVRKVPGTVRKGGGEVPGTLFDCAVREVPGTVHEGTVHEEVPGTVREMPGTARGITAIHEVIRLRLPSSSTDILATLADASPLWANWNTAERAVSLVVRKTEAARLASHAVAPQRDEPPLGLVAATSCSASALPRIASQMLGALTDEHITLHEVALPGSAPRTAAVLVEASEVRRAVRVLHRSLLAPRVGPLPRTDRPRSAILHPTGG